jgi:hypothetical protein
MERAELANQRIQILDMQMSTFSSLDCLPPAPCSVSISVYTMRSCLGMLWTVFGNTTLGVAHELFVRLLHL